MDPISVSASILGLLGAAAKISEILTSLVSSSRSAPKNAQRLLNEVNDLRLCFCRLQDFVSGFQSGLESRRTMVMVDQVVATLTSCVMAFSELEEVIAWLKSNNSHRADFRIRWMVKEQTISKILERLHSSKVSLNLMLTALTCTQVEEANAAIENLTKLVQTMISSNQEMTRLSNDGHLTKYRRFSAPTKLRVLGDNIDDGSTIRSQRPQCGDQISTPLFENRSLMSTFEHDLRSSRVYSRVSRPFNRKSDPYPGSLLSSELSMGWSFFSGMSLADISDISVISLPISATRLWNGSRYRPSLDSIRNSNSYGISAVALDPIGKLQLFGESNDSLSDLEVGNGISNSGKSTFLKQLHMMRGMNPSTIELDEARNLIYSSLVKAFKYVWSQKHEVDLDLRQDDGKQSMGKDFSVIGALPDDFHQLGEDLEWALQAFKNLWKHPKIEWFLRSENWPAIPHNVPFMLDNLDRLFVGPDAAILSLQTLREDDGAVKNEMMETLAVFETLVNLPALKNTSVFLFLNKADLFEYKIWRFPISQSFTDYTGGSSYWEGCQYFANRFGQLDRRPLRKLHCFITDVMNTDSFRNAWQQVQEKILYESLKF
ncbi:MAG: hypothetical protein LQ342_004322 [Letrouitia transgressa]|nr:MAG: hypothetical protein LQ342_004322 [Letrouitia transgressa]